MSLIRIKKEDNWCYRFDSNAPFYTLNTRTARCSYCGLYLDFVYISIIDDLKEAKLLPEDYKLICCYCDVLVKFGLIELRKDLTSFFYDHKDDILGISFIFSSGFNTRHRVYFYIHDFKKVMEDF